MASDASTAKTEIDPILATCSSHRGSGFFPPRTTHFFFFASESRPARQQFLLLLTGLWPPTSTLIISLGRMRVPCWLLAIEIFGQIAQRHSFRLNLGKRSRIVVGAPRSFVQRQLHRALLKDKTKWTLRVIRCCPTEMLAIATGHQFD